MEKYKISYHGNPAWLPMDTRTLEIDVSNDFCYDSI